MLLLPAFSTVSTRLEMAGIAQLLASQYQAVLVDWLGFGDSDRPLLDYSPQIYQQLLADFVLSVFNNPIILVAAGHASGYAIKFAKDHRDRVSQLVLVAPTWLGPLGAMGMPPGIRDGVRALVRSPILGQFLYHLNTTPSFLRWMYRRHVYTDASLLTPDFIAQKHQITQRSGARYAPAAFVTGKLDPVSSRSEFLADLEALSLPILLLLAAQAPPKSKSEMEAMVALPNVQSVKLPGTLGIHEEFPQPVAEAIAPGTAPSEMN
jgi:pimeloyl-ACP methyl ester carboxylesterase